MNDESLRTNEVFIENELKSAYLAYAMAVIVGRALPEVRDGLKPVHRRIIYAMRELGLVSNKSPKKSARIVGEVMGKYHPHGDMAIYDAMVRLAQYWNMRYTLVKGQGNFGSVDGDNPAASRYTEAKLEKIADEFLKDIEKETVDMQLNYDETIEEPKVLPTRVPNLLLNGSSGIAVGMATNIPPHNLGELVDAAVDIIDNPKQTCEELVRKGFVKAPDFPTGALILNNEQIQQFYLTGKGGITMKGVCSIEERKKGREAIIIEEIPYQVNKTNLIDQIVNLVKTGKVKDIVDVIDESTKIIRLVIEVRKDVDPNIILNQLYKYTSLQQNFNAHFLAIVNQTPVTLDLKSYLHHFIDFRQEVIVKRTQFDLRKTQERMHILEGLIIALNNIDAMIKLIKASKTGPEARASLMDKYKLSELQAQAILDMKLQKLTGLEIDKIKKEFKDLEAFIKSLQAILDSEKVQFKIIKTELAEIKKLYADERKSKLIDDLGNVNIEDLIQDEDFVVMVTQNDYIKKVPLEAYRSQKRGGKGSKAHIKDEDTIKNLFIANSKDNVLIFANDGSINWMKAYEVPTVSAQSKGRPIVNYIDLRGRGIANIINVSDMTKGYLIFLTKKGIIKKTEMSNFAKPRAGGIKAINLDEGDSVLNVAYSAKGDEDIVTESNVGLAIRFKQADLSVLGRTARGVKSMNLRDGETVVGLELVVPGKTMLTISEGGYGKRSLLSEYPTIKRAGRGVIDIKTGGKNGNVVTLKAVGEDDELLIVTTKGKVIRSPVSDIRIIGRNTKGVRVVSLDEEDKVQKVEIVVSEEDLEE